MADWDDEEDEPTPLSDEELAELAPRCTDSANVDAIVREHGKGYRYVVEWDSWLSWDGRRWVTGGASGRVKHCAVLTARAEHVRTSQRIRELEEECKPLRLQGDKDAVDKIEARIKYLRFELKWHEQSQNASRVDAAARLLQTRLVVSMTELDRDPWLFNVANGTLDLRTADLKPHDRADMITQLTDIEWSDGASAPTWDTFVHTVMGGDRELVTYLARLVGYALTGLTREHILAFFYGTGRNGKSTFTRTIQRVFGEYGCSAARDLLFEDKRGQRHPEEIAKLFGKRLAICAEIGEHHSFDEAKVKDLTGGDVISARRMRENSWDLVPTHKLFLSGNHKPVVKGDDLGIWRRIRLVPWTVTVSDEAVDGELPEKLVRELPGVLRWAVNGCLEWQRMGLTEPDSVVSATRDYRAESDVLGEFLSGRVVFGPTETCSRQALRESYEGWCKEAGHMPVGARKIAQRLRERGVTHTSVREGARVKDGWRGVRMKGDYDVS